MIHSVFFKIGKFDELMTVQALGMMVGFFIINVLKMMVFVSKGGFANNAGFQEFPQAAVHRRARDFFIFSFAGFDEVFCVEVTMSGKDFLKNSLPALAKFKAGAF